MKRIIFILLAAIIALYLCACESNFPEGDDDMDTISAFEFPKQPDFGREVSVHDPSVIRANNGKYYAFGSHFAVSVSDDLITWTQYSRDGEANKLYDGNWRTVLANANEYVKNAASTWAPSVIYMNGKYYMYYSLSTFGSQTSFIGRVESDSIIGPYTNSVEIIRSGDVNGPNAIDPEVFFDNEGKLWMVYGSFFAGIYIKELYASGNKIGLPKKDGFGKRLWMGNMQNGPEGPFIFYNPQTKYYYLMVSHASLSRNYNMRVARSKNPDGPYVDIDGNNVSDIQNSGVKLAGNYQFANYSTGYAALGHNSVIKVDNKYFVVHHLRYRQGENVSGYHNQNTRQLFFNEDGWPVLAPNRYAGESLGKVTLEQASGFYDLLFHTNDNLAGFAESKRYELRNDGSIVYEEEQFGTWEISEAYYITIKIGEDTYKGVVIPQWNNDLKKAGLSITAIASTSTTRGPSLWANAV
ncbi:MAG: family 43 glycosylhydrolase [Firmicutes bacterium]|nr:family 43 glycosylhydrolase [Bacillota bacterium]